MQKCINPLIQLLVDVPLNMLKHRHTLPLGSRSQTSSVCGRLSRHVQASASDIGRPDTQPDSAQVDSAQARAEAYARKKRGAGAAPTRERGAGREPERQPYASREPERQPYALREPERQPYASRSVGLSLLNGMYPKVCKYTHALGPVR